VEPEFPGEVTRLLQDWRTGDAKAVDALVPQLYKELRRLAHFQLQKERPNHTLQSTALVHEAYARLVGQSEMQFESRTHFLAIAAQLMRQILVDYARRRRAEKRGGGAFLLNVDDAQAQPTGKDVDVVALDDALQALAKIDERQSRVVELRFFAGMSLEETAQALEVGTATVQRDWTMAKAWLYRELSEKAEK
jgi:RNA polymerase sigma factor (TIGR02999 family)